MNTNIKKFKNGWYEFYFDLENKTLTDNTIKKAVEIFFKEPIFSEVKEGHLMPISNSLRQ